MTITEDRCAFADEGCTCGRPPLSLVEGTELQQLRAELRESQFQRGIALNALHRAEADVQRLTRDGIAYANENARLRSQLDYFQGPPKQPGRVRVTTPAERAPLYAAYKAAREWAEKNGESYTDDGIIQAAARAYRAELIAQARTGASR